MEILKLWEHDFPLYDTAITNDENKDSNLLRFYGVKSENPAPVVVIFPGGGYAFRNDIDEGDPIAKFFNTRGFHAAVVNYRVAPYHYPAPLLDAQRAIKLLRFHAKRLGIDPNRVFTLGFSAGGHLCGMTAAFPDICNLHGDDIDAMSAKPTGAILCYPVISADDDKTHRSSFQCLLGDDFSRRQEFSIEKRVNHNTCPCFIFHCAGDVSVSPQNAITLTSSLLTNKIDCHLHIFQGGEHGGGLRKNDIHANLWPTLAANWIDSF